MDYGYDCQVTFWPSKYKRKHTSHLWRTLLHKKKKSTEREEDVSFAELCFDNVSEIEIPTALPPPQLSRGPHFPHSRLVLYPLPPPLMTMLPCLHGHHQHMTQVWLQKMLCVGCCKTYMCLYWWKWINSMWQWYMKLRLLF